MRSTNYILSAIVVAAFLSEGLISCSTGIETTKTIKMSKSDKKQTMQSAEEILASNLVSESLSQWKPGKRFLVTDDKASLILDTPGGESSERNADAEILLHGAILQYAGTELHKDAGGNTNVVIDLTDGKHSFTYNTGRNSEDAVKNLTGTDMPLMIDLDLVAMADSLLRGRSVWIKTGLWYDSEKQNIEGKKFVPVVIKSVRPGDQNFPFIIDFEDAEGHAALIYMNSKSANGLGAESRTFPSLFSLTDPKLKYPAIDPEIWELIQQGKLREGMTKDECKLSLGNPTEVDAGHNWSNAIDIWRYKDGSFLHFENGLLVNYRH